MDNAREFLNYINAAKMKSRNVGLNSWLAEMSIMEQELLTLSEHLSSPPGFRGVRVALSLILCVCFVDRCCPFVLFILVIVLSVLLRYTDSGIFKFFL